MRRTMKQGQVATQSTQTTWDYWSAWVEDEGQDGGRDVEQNEEQKQGAREEQEQE